MQGSKSWTKRAKTFNFYLFPISYLVHCLSTRWSLWENSSGKPQYVNYQIGMNNSSLLNELSFQDTKVPFYNPYFSYIVMVYLDFGRVNQPYPSRQPIFGDQVPRYYFYNRPFVPFQFKTMEFATGKKKVINYCMQFLPVTSSSPGGNYISITGEPICNLSGSACTTISSWVLRSITKPAHIHAQHIYRGSRAKSISIQNDNGRENT